jgi:methyltransferase (TIGR00027 family)
LVAAIRQEKHMFKSPGRIVYRVSDLEKAKEWYRQILGNEPVFDSPVGVVFLVGTSILGLAPRTGSSYGEDGAIVYWAVDDAVSSCRRLCELGATPHTDIATMGGMRFATVKDPFGNVVGVISEVNASENTVEQKPSDTARGVANLRFLATLDEREEIRGRDYLAEVFVPEEWKTTFRDSAKREWFVTKFLPPGMYWGHIARTAWFDGLVEEALRGHIPQIVFLGAGYDSRAYRFSALIKDSRIFELDAPPTQEHKRSLLEKAGIAIPDGLAFVPTDFTNIGLKDALFSAGFDKKQKTLYIWEGVTYYLPAEAIDGILSFIQENSPLGSTVCFDYYSTFPGMDEAYGVKEQRDFMRTHSPGERMQFSIERKQIESFLSERGFALTEHLTPEEMQKRYLTLKNGSIAGKTGAGICFVCAMVA